MELNIIKLSLGSLLLLFICISCSNRNESNKQTAIRAVKKETCLPDAVMGGDLVFKTGCKNCHHVTEKRVYPQMPTFSELSATDSIKLSAYIFKSKHNGMYLKNSRLSENTVMALDSLDDCQKKSLIYYIKNYNRNIPHVLSFPEKRN